MSNENLTNSFPGSVWTELPSDERRAMAMRYCRAMWGDREGVAALAIGYNPHAVAGKLKHKPFTQEFFEWPRDIEAIADRAMTCASQRSDVYVSPMLRKDHRRLKVNGAGGRWAWADLDGPMTAERLALLRSLGDSVRVISSGTGHHAYFMLDEWRTPDEIEATNRALRDMLGGDAKWSNESLLRLPGTFNTKPSVFHNRPPALVQAVTL
jgi:hypothetical protein